MLDFRDMYRLRLNKTKEVVATSVGLRHSKKGKVFPYSLPSVGPGADPGIVM